MCVADDEFEAEDCSSSNLSCKSFARETNFLRNELAAAEQPFGWSDLSQKSSECNVIIMRKFSSRNQHHLSLLRSLRASQVLLFCKLLMILPS